MTYNATAMEFADNRPAEQGLMTPAEENFGRSFLVLSRKKLLP
jgi:hypothetical protein